MRLFHFLLVINFGLFFTWHVLQAQCINDSNFWSESWTSCTASPNPNIANEDSHWILYEFSEAQIIGGSHIWNSNNVGESQMGVKTLLVDFSRDGESWETLGIFEVEQANELESYQGVVGPDFGAKSIKKILFTVLESYSSNPCVSLAEVRFDIEAEEAEESEIETALSELINKAELSIYPNPTSNELFVNLGRESLDYSLLEIADLQGKLFYSQSIAKEVRVSGTSLSIYCRDFPDGFYLLRMIGQKDQVVRAFLKQ